MENRKAFLLTFLFPSIIDMVEDQMALHSYLLGLEHQTAMTTLASTYVSEIKSVKFP